MSQHKKSWYKKWWGILIIFILSIFLMGTIAFGFLVADYYKQYKAGELNLNLDNTNNQSQPITPEIMKKIEGDGSNYWIGAKDPKVTIVEFADFSCPMCKNSFTKIREISQKYKDDVKIIFRDYPSVTEYSSDLAKAGRCAGEQKLFWPMHDKLFLNQGVSTINQITALAEQIGVDKNQFTKCLSSIKYDSIIYKDITDGLELGIKGTPTWFINGYGISGDIPRDKFFQLIEQLLDNF